MNIYRVCGRKCPARRGACVTGTVCVRHVAPYHTVQYRTTPCLTLQQEHTAKHILPCLSQRKPGGKKAAVGNRRKCGKLCGKLASRRSGRAWSGAGAAEHGGVPTGGTCGCGRGFWSGTVRRVLSAGAGVVDAFGWRVVAAVRCGTRVQRRARWLAFFPREKMLDKLCKSILNWKQGITQAAAGDGLRHRPHRRSCSAHPTSTSSVAATSVMRCAFDARLSGAALRKRRRKTPPRIEPMLGGVL